MDYLPTLSGVPHLTQLQLLLVAGRRRLVLGDPRALTAVQAQLSLHNGAQRLTEAIMVLPPLFQVK